MEDSTVVLISLCCRYFLLKIKNEWMVYVGITVVPYDGISVFINLIF